MPGPRRRSARASLRFWSQAGRGSGHRFVGDAGEVDGAFRPHGSLLPKTSGAARCLSGAASEAPVVGIVLEGWGDDIEDGPLTGNSLVWTSNVNGNLGSGENVSLSPGALQVGEHVITLTPTDSDAMSGTASVSITVTSGGGGFESTIQVGSVYGDCLVTNLVVNFKAKPGIYTFFVGNPTEGLVQFVQDGEIVDVLPYDWKFKVGEGVSYTFDFVGTLQVSVTNALPGRINLYGMSESIFDNKETVVVPGP